MDAPTRTARLPSRRRSSRSNRAKRHLSSRVAVAGAAAPCPNQRARGDRCVSPCWAYLASGWVCWCAAADRGGAPACVRTRTRAAELRTSHGVGERHHDLIRRGVVELDGGLEQRASAFETGSVGWVAAV